MQKLYETIPIDRAILLEVDIQNTKYYTSTFCGIHSDTEYMRLLSSTALRREIMMDSCLLWSILSMATIHGEPGNGEILQIFNDSHLF